MALKTNRSKENYLIYFLHFMIHFSYRLDVNSVKSILFITPEITSLSQTALQSYKIGSHHCQVLREQYINILISYIGYYIY